MRRHQDKQPQLNTLPGTYTSERSELRTATVQSSLMEASKGELEGREETTVRTIKYTTKFTKNALLWHSSASIAAYSTPLV